MDAEKTSRFGPGITLASFIDHTLLKAAATSKQIETLCHEAIDWKFASVCINPSYVSLAARFLAAASVKVCTVIGFPLGSTTTKQKWRKPKKPLPTVPGKLTW